MYNGFIANKFMGLGGFGGKKVVGVGFLMEPVLLMIPPVRGWMNVPAVTAHKKKSGQPAQASHPDKSPHSSNVSTLQVLYQ